MGLFDEGLGVIWREGWTLLHSTQDADLHGIGEEQFFGNTDTPGNVNLRGQQVNTQQGWINAAVITNVTLSGLGVTTNVGTLAPSQPTEFLTDPFTNTNGTSITSHTTYTTWATVMTGGTAPTIQSNRLQCASDATGLNFYYASATPPSANYLAEAAIYFVADNGQDDQWHDAAVGVRCGTTGGGQGYVFGWNHFWGRWELGKWLSGGYSELESEWTTDLTRAVGDARTIRLEVSGSSTTNLKCYVNDVLFVEYDDSTSPITATGRVGVFLSNAYRNFNIDSVLGAPLSATVTNVNLTGLGVTVTAGDGRWLIQDYTFVSDTFSDPDSTALTAHTGEKGASWTVARNSNSTVWSIQSGEAKPSSTTGYNYSYASGIPLSPDYQVSATYNYIGNGDGGYSDTITEGVVARMGTDGLSGYVFGYDFGDSQWQIDKIGTGAVASVSTGSWAGEDVLLTLVVNGAVIKGYVDSTEVLSYTDPSPITAAGRAGIHSYNYINPKGAFKELNARQLAGASATLSGLGVTTGQGTLTPSIYTLTQTALTGLGVTAAQGTLGYSESRSVGATGTATATPSVYEHTGGVLPGLIHLFQNRFVYRNGTYRGYGETDGGNTRGTTRVFEYVVDPADQNPISNIWANAGSLQDMVPEYNGNPSQTLPSGNQYSDARYWSRGGQISQAEDGSIAVIYTRVYDIGYTYPDVKVLYTYQNFDHGSAYYGPEVVRDNVTQANPITTEGAREAAIGLCAIDVNTAYVVYPSYWNNGGTTNWVPTLQKVSQVGTNYGSLVGSAIQLTSFTGASACWAIPKAMCVTHSGYGGVVYITYLSGTAGSPLTPAYVGLIVLDTFTGTVSSHTLTTVASAPTTLKSGNDIYQSVRVPTRTTAQVAKLSNNTSVTQYLLGTSATQVVHLSWTSGTATTPTLTVKNGPTSDTGNGYYMVGGWESLEVRDDTVVHVLYHVRTAGAPQRNYFRLCTNDATGTGSSWTTSGADVWDWTTTSASYDWFLSADAKDVDTWLFQGYVNRGVGGASLLAAQTGWLDYWAGQKPFLTVEAKAQVGRTSVTVVNGINQAITGLGVTTAQGALTPSVIYNTGLTGLSVTTAQGSLTPSQIGGLLNVSLTGLSVTTARGTLTPQDYNAPVVVPLAGLNVRAIPDVLVPSVSYTVALTGLGITTSRGSITPTGVISLTGLGVTTARGSLTQLGSYPLTGFGVMTAQGSLAQLGSYSLSGLGTTASPGALTPFIAYPLTGLGVTTAQGSLSPSISYQVGLVGKTITTGVGQFGTMISKGLSGLQANGERGALQTLLAKDLTGLSVAVSQSSFGVRVDANCQVSGVEAQGEVGSAIFDGSSVPPSAFLWAFTEAEKLREEKEIEELFNDATPVG